MIEYAPRPAFIPFHNRSQRWATLVTHRRAGKTVALVNDITYAARTPLQDPATSLMRPYPQYAYIGPTYTQAKRVAWQYLKNYTEPYWAKPPSESELKVTLIPTAPADTPSTIYCLGADNADSLRGMYLDGAVCDEYALWRPSVFSQVLRPALSDRNGWGVFASTPRGKNVFHDVYRRALKNPSDNFLLILEAFSSGLIAPRELADLQRDMDPEEFAQEYLCSFDSALKGAIYASEVNALLADSRYRAGPPGSPSASLYDPALPVDFVFDLGFTDSTVRIAYQLHPRTLQVAIVNVFATSGQTIDVHINDLTHLSGQQQVNIGTVWLPPDARAKNLQTGRSIVETFLQSGITPRVVPVHNVRDGISAVRHLFPRLVLDASGDPPVCEDLLEALKTYHREWDDNLLTFKDTPLHDWSSDYADALRYLAMVVPRNYTQERLSSDNAAQEELDRHARAWRPSIGYNLETLHEDAATSSFGERVMP